MENIKKFSCWDCQYFAAVDVETSRSGYCRRFAPHALDYHGTGGGGIVSPLTTKGDLFGYDTADARFPVGTDGQILAADSAEGVGLKWVDPPAPGGSPLTTKGDLFGYDTADARFPVGTDGQILAADSAEGVGLKWVDPATPGGVYLITEQAARFDAVQQTTALFSRDGEPPGSGTVKAISNPFTVYDNGGSFPFIAPYDAALAEIVAFQICLTACAVGGQTLGAAPYIKIDFYSIVGSGETLVGSIQVPTDPLKTAIQNNTGTPNYQNLIYVLPTRIALAAGGMYGWRCDVNSGQDTQMIGAIRNTNTKIYLSVTTAPAALAALIFGASTERAPVPATESSEKWALIVFGDLGWCGHYKQSSAAIPPLPPLP